MPPRDRARAARQFLDRNLFPESKPTLAELGRWQKIGLLAGLIALGVVIQIGRIGFHGSLDSLWAEDGSIFVQGALTKSFAHTLFAEYSGYLVVLLRLIGEVASAFPLRDAPAVISILSAILVTLSGVAIWYATSGHLANPYLRGTLVLMIVLTPVGGLETIDSAANVSWYMLFAVFWLLLWRPRSDRGAVLAAVFITFTALTNPGVWFFLPVAALRAFAARGRRDLIIVGTYFGAGIVQLFALALSSYEAIEPEWTSDIWAVLLQRVIDGAAFGLRLGGEAWIAFGWPFLIVLTTAMIAGLVTGLARSGWTARCFALIAVPIALGMFLFSVYQRAVGTPMLWHAGEYGVQAGRYTIVPAMLLVSVAFMFVDREARPRRLWSRGDWVLAGTVALMVVSIAVSLPARDLQSRGTPPWSASLDAAAAKCRAGAKEEVRLAISPPSFEMELPCSTIPGASEPPSQR